MKLLKLYDINFSKYINDTYPDVSFWAMFMAETEEEALKKLYNFHKNINCILSIVEIEK